MSYASEKGANGEREAAGYFSDVFAPQGYKFVRIGGAERNKKFLHGDVVLDHRTDKDSRCFLRDYFIEVKKRERVDPYEVLEEAEKHSRELGKGGEVLYLIRQGKGEKRDGTIVVMSPKTFKFIARHLQGYIEEDGNN